MTPPTGKKVRGYTAPEVATMRGHCVQWDPPFDSNVERWTCSTCGSAVLKHRGNVYGSAVEQDCPTPLIGSKGAQ